MNVTAALNSILDAVGSDISPNVSFVGVEPVLPTPMRLATAGAAALGAVGTAVDRVWQMRGGNAQRISVALAHAGAAVRSNELMRRDGALIKDLWRGPSGFHKCGDSRWIRFHCNFAHHEQAVRRTLACDGDNAAIASAVRQWRAQDLEDAVLAAGGCAYMIRDTSEWEAHPQADAIAALPLIEIIKIGEAPPMPFTAGTRPLSGIRALDLTRVIAGPVIGRTLAEHGADVMRIAAPQLPFIEPLVIDTGHGKLSAHLDLETADGCRMLRMLLDQSDIFTQSYRPGALAARGFSPDAIARDFPGTICVTLSAWSHVGPWAGRRGFDSLVQCATGWAAELGGADSPRMQPAQAIDYVSGYLGAFGAIEALRRRAVEGGTWLVRLSLAQTGLWISSLGRNPEADVRSRKVPDENDLADILIDSRTPFGIIHHPRPVLGLSETPPFWQRPAVPLGTHPPAWPGTQSNDRTHV